MFEHRGFLGSFSQCFPHINRTLCTCSEILGLGVQQLLLLGLVGHSDKAWSHRKYKSELRVLRSLSLPENPQMVSDKWQWEPPEPCCAEWKRAYNWYSNRYIFVFFSLQFMAIQSAVEKVHTVWNRRDACCYSSCPGGDESISVAQFLPCSLLLLIPLG